MLKRHLRSTYNLTPDEYRARWGLAPDYPMVAPKYAEQRSEFAKKIGLGRGTGRQSARDRRQEIDSARFSAATFAVVRPVVPRRRQGPKRRAPRCRRRSATRAMPPVRCSDRAARYNGRDRSHRSPSPMSAVPRSAPQPRMPRCRPRASPAFDWADPLLLRGRAQRGRAHGRATAPAPIARKSCCRACSRPTAHERFDREIMNEMGALGFLGSTHRGLWLRRRQLCLATG